MNKIQEYIYNLLPPNKQRSNGWIHFNCPSCTNHGDQRNDTKERGNILFEGEGIIYQCFNCKLKWGWSPGHYMGKGMYDWLKDVNASYKDIYNIRQLIDEYNGNPLAENVDVKPKRIIRDIPEGYKSIIDSLYQGDKSETLKNVYQYICQRNARLLSWANLMWKENENVFLIPCYEFNKIVGYSLRRIDDVTPKYIHYIPSGYLFNFDVLFKDRKYVIVTEGQADALSIDGISILSNSFTQDKLERLMQYSNGKEVILLPDKDEAGKKMVTQMLENNYPFSVSFPNWEKGIKDAEDAVKKYGRLYTLYTILNSIERDKSTIEIKCKIGSFFNN